MNDKWNFSASQIFSYYPKYEYLDNVISLTDKKKMNLFIDVKGCAQALFQEWAVTQMIFNTEGSRIIDTSLFSAIMDFISFHKLYAKKRDIDLNMYFFMESGRSKYHLDVYSEYKSNRDSGDFFGLDMEKKELFHTILDKNYTVTEKVANRIPNVYFIRLSRTEADFVPWYLMNHALDPSEVDASNNIIYSMDKDMLQCLDAPNIFQFYRHYQCVKMITQKDIYNHWLKETLDIDDGAVWFPLALSIIGDTGDGFKGVKGVGPKTLVKIFDYIQTLCGNSMEKVYKNISEGQPIFSKSYSPFNSSLKKVVDGESIIIRNLKLASYKLLSDYINGDYPTEVFKKKQQIKEIVENQIKCRSANVLYNALDKVGHSDLISEQTLTNLF